ncbi:gephyrin-like molybdotransferase Glp [Marinobacter sp. BGYM27]|uniref:molybdopterin molybdotransferase MoeA n=1 Tax=unclassified Marinobacter TaxID=83889 RepID=UPI0021A35913|nr:gephyrin-like molybdotransferase Glp [Marinobacter sp. BGYM27]MDG5499882.1 molybdopterin molybdotransferase MoeA [Marinobacter sp. BGYM27]
MTPLANLTSLDEALPRILEQVSSVEETEVRTLTSALGCILAQDAEASINVPPTDNSAVDGYAIRIADLGGAPIPVSQRIPAGEAPPPLLPGTAARIFTGASIPEGADAVLMQEYVDASDAGISTKRPVESRQNIRPQGQDICAGDIALHSGIRLRAQELGLLASLGIDRVHVRRPMRVAILTTGDELIDPGLPPAPGKIFNTNRYTLHGLLHAMGCVVIDPGTIADTREATEQALAAAAETADLVITSGGVSVGEEDHVRTSLEAIGQVALWRLALKPGKPLAFGRIGTTPILGLPGNPAAVLVTFLMIGAPVIRRLQGLNAATVKPVYLPAGFAITRSSPRREFIRVQQVNEADTTTLRPHPNQSSGMLSSACWADGLAMIPENTTITPRTPVAFYSFSTLTS